VITTTEAFVLKSMKYRDTSKIVTFYTRRYGKVKGVAKGARETKSKFGASVEPVVLSSVVFYKKEHRDLHLISQSDLLKPYARIHDDMARMRVALAVVELVDQLTHGEEENIQLFSLIQETLDAIERAEQNQRVLLVAFELRLAAIFGFALTLDRCARCGAKMDRAGESKPMLLELRKGGLLCGTCASVVGEKEHLGPGIVSTSPQEVMALDKILHGRMPTLARLHLSDRIGNKVAELTRLYLRHHFETLRPLKSEAVFQQIVG
jgi:DNA repair protein RecO (recombination protein O)